MLRPRLSMDPGDPPSGTRRGAALLLSLLVLLVLVVIMSQLNIATVTDARVSRNDLSLTAMDLAVESTLLDVQELLAADAESGAEGGGAAGDPFSEMGGGSAGGEESGPVDSRQDDWTKPTRPEVNGIRLRVLIQDEDSKLNVLTMLSEDEIEADKAFERVVRVLDTCRLGTKADIEEGDARALAETMREHLRNRKNSFLPRPTLLTDEEQNEDLGLPLSLREFVCLEGFNEDLFRDFYDEEGTVVHSIGSFLTCSTAVTTRDEMVAADAEGPDAPPGAPTGSGEDAAGEGEIAGAGESGAGDGGGSEGGGGSGGGGGGGPQSPTFGGQSGDQAGAGGPGGGGGGTSVKSGVAVNINTAPACVLKALMDDRDVPPRLWDRILEYRNEEDEEALGEDEEPPLDEWNEPVIVTKIFESLADLEEFEDYRDLEADVKGELQGLLTVESHVFSVFVTARKPTGVGGGFDLTKEEVEAEERSGQSLMRTVQSTLWRREGGDGWELVPLERWAVIDYMPFEVQDFPEEDR
jgi:hypothetical protein